MKERPPTMPPTRWPTATFPPGFALCNVADSAAVVGRVNDGTSVGRKATSCALSVEDGIGELMDGTISLCANSPPTDVVGIAALGISDIVVSDTTIGRVVTESRFCCIDCG